MYVRKKNQHLMLKGAVTGHLTGCSGADQHNSANIGILRIVKAVSYLILT